MFKGAKNLCFFWVLLVIAIVYLVALKTGLEDVSQDEMFSEMSFHFLLSSCSSLVVFLICSVKKMSLNEKPKASIRVRMILIFLLLSCVVFFGGLVGLANYCQKMFPLAFIEGRELFVISTAKIYSTYLIGFFIPSMAFCVDLGCTLLFARECSFAE